MMSINSRIATLAAGALVLLIPLASANGPAAKSSNLATSKASTAGSARSVWPPETLSGRITMVDPTEKLVVVKAPDGVLFDMVVTANTVIKSRDHTIGLKELLQDLNKNASIKFIPERRGDVARSIHIAG
jgi:hypothetical protein